MTEYADLAYTLGSKKRSPHDRKREWGYGLLKQSMSEQPIDHPMQGVARLAQALVGGWTANKADEAEKADNQKRSAALAAAMAEPDPQKRMAALAVYDPDIGARSAGSWAVKQAELQEQRRALQGADLSTGYGMAPSGPPGMPPPLPQVNAPGDPQGFANNSGNIRVSGAPWQDKGTPYNGFETFPTPQAGVNAHLGNLKAYVQQNPNITVAQAFAKWAPPNENNTQAYIRQIAEATGINPGMPLAEVLKDPAVAAILLDAQTRLEKGGLPPGFNADTFTQAAGGKVPASGPPVQIAGPPMAGPPVQGPQPPPQMAPQAPPGQPPAPQPGVVSSPTLVAPEVPDVPRPQPTPEMLAKHDRIYRSGGYGKTREEADKNVRVAIEAELEREWNVRRERAYKEHDIKRDDYKSARERDEKRPQELFGNEAKMRDDFRGEPVVKSYREVVPIMESVREAIHRPTRAADLNLIYGLGKLMDPNSVVREGEMVMARGTGTVQDYINGLLGQLNGGQTLQPETRQKIVAEMESRFGPLKASHDSLFEQYTAAAKSYGLDPQRIFFGVRPPGNDKRTSGSPDNTPSQEELKRWATGGDLKTKYGLE